MVKTISKNPSLTGYKFMLKGFKQFMKNQLTIATLNENARIAINHNISVKIDELIKAIDDVDLNTNNRLIHTITAVRKNGRHTRTPGYFFNFIKANEYVCNNIKDLWEGDYEYIVIEAAPEGLYAIDGRKEYWYFYDEDSHVYRACDKPEKFNNKICWGIG